MTHKGNLKFKNQCLNIQPCLFFTDCIEALLEDGWLLKNPAYKWNKVMFTQRNMARKSFRLIQFE